MLLPGVGSETDAVRVAERIIEVLEEPFEVEGANWASRPVAGSRLAPGDGDSADVLLQRADVAMYVAKDSQASVVVYTDELNMNTPARLALLGDLRNAVARGEFVLHYQPKASMRTGQDRREPRRSSAGSTPTSDCSIPTPSSPRRSGPG